MRPNRTVLNEATIINARRKSSDTADFKVSDYGKLPYLNDLKKYLAEITREFYKQRAQKLGREYSVSSVERVHEAYSSGTRHIFLMKVKAISTDLKAKPIIGYKSLTPLSKPSRWYELRFLVYIDLTNYLVKNTVTNLRKDLDTAQCYYDCNCMSFHFHGMRYRASRVKWAMYPTNIPDNVQRKKFGTNSKVCKHIAAFSIDLAGFAGQIKNHIDKLI